MQSQVFDIWPKYPMYFNNSIASHIYECFSLDLGTNAEKHDISLMINGQDAKSCPICRQREGGNLDMRSQSGRREVTEAGWGLWSPSSWASCNRGSWCDHNGTEKYQYYFKFSWENVKIAQCKIYYRHLFCLKSLKKIILKIYRWAAIWPANDVILWHFSFRELETFSET